LKLHHPPSLNHDRFRAPSDPAPREPAPARQRLFATLLATAVSALLIACNTPAPSPPASPTSAAAAAATSLAPPLQPVPSLDLARYAGRWYQIALIPNQFQARCVSDTSAEYVAQPDGRIQVINRCTTESGRVDQAVGIARLDGTLDSGRLSPARLEVTFVPGWLRWLDAVWANYWVIQLADDYRYAVISEPSREYLWVLAREPRISADDDARIRAKLVEQGFSLDRLQSHQQSGARRTP
jgi:apolipoprotein D and lipocalin family protein